VLTCGEQTLSTYLSMTSPCVIGRLAFSNFSYEPITFGDGTSLTPDQLMVNPSRATPGNPGIQFTGPWTVNGLGGGDAAIGFLITVLPGWGFIDSATLDATFQVDQPNVFAGVVETICLGGQQGFNCPAEDTVKLRVDNQSPGPVSVAFEPQTRIAVTKDLFYDGLTVNASGMISEMDNHYPASVSEPVTTLLVLTGLLLILRPRRERAH